MSVRRPGDNSPARPMNAEFVTGNYFTLFGLSPAAGRLIAPADDQVNATPAAVLSYRAWQNYFASDPSIIGSSIILNNLHFTVVGVAPAGFFGDRLTDSPADFWLPLATEPALRGEETMLPRPNQHWLYLLGRLKPGVSPQQVQSKVTVELQQWLNSTEGSTTVGDNDRSKIAKQKTLMLPAAGGVNNLERDTSKGLRLLMALSGLVLLIACANIANLLLARGAARKTQTSVRLALGARRSRLVQQLLTESVLLAVIGGAVGLLVAYLGTRSILAIAFRGSEFIPIDPNPSTPVMLFSFALALVTGVMFGVAPAWIASHADPAEALRGVSRSTTHGATFPQKLLVVVQAALSLVLIAGAILLVQSLRKLEHQNFGFQSDNRYIVRLGRAFVDKSPETLATTTPLAAKAEQHSRRNHCQLFVVQPVGRRQLEWVGLLSRPGAHIRQTKETMRRGCGSAPITFRRSERACCGDAPSANKTLQPRRRSPWSTSALRRSTSRTKTPSVSTSAPTTPNTLRLRNRRRSGRRQVPGHSWRAYRHVLPALSAERGVLRTRPTMSGEIASQRIQTIELHVAGTPENLESTVRRELSRFDPDITVLRMTSFGEQVSEAFNQERLLARLTTLFGASGPDPGVHRTLRRHFLHR